MDTSMLVAAGMVQSDNNRHVIKSLVTIGYIQFKFGQSIATAIAANYH